MSRIACMYVCMYFGDSTFFYFPTMIIVVILVNDNRIIHYLIVISLNKLDHINAYIYYVNIVGSSMVWIHNNA